ncbi:MAG TPA: hypothetical protein VMY88_02095 [Acidimicrobiales bacterium]|nr:hypothetical protein [Acidimicrobiales bacterium]
MNPIEESMFEDGDEKSHRKVRRLQNSLWEIRHGGGGGQLLFTRDEVAAVLRTKPETIDKMVAKGRLPAVVLDEDEPPLFRPESVLRFLDELAPPKKRHSREDDEEDYSAP